jgi:hypothetical protein
MEIMIKNPANKNEAVALSKEQFAVVHDYIVGCMNTQKKAKDAVVVDMLIAANLPIVFKTKP